MNRYNILIILFFIFFAGVGLYGMVPLFPSPLMVKICKQDTLKENQVLHNGRIWRNLYYLIEGDQFLFSKKFLPGSVAINGKIFSNVSLKYDIYKDEILTPVDTGGILQLNKELTDSFSISFENKKYQFIRLQDDSLKGSKKYFNVLYKGKTALCIKYFKKIEHPADGGDDKFYAFNRIYFVKDKLAYMIKGKRDLMKILIKEKELIRAFIKKNKLYVSDKEPESFIPVIKYYDSISN